MMNDDNDDMCVTAEADGGNVGKTYVGNGV